MQCLQVCQKGSKIDCFILFVFLFVYREVVLGLTAQPHLGWSSHTHSNTGIVA